MQKQAYRIYVCHGLTCSHHPVHTILNTLQSEVRRRGLEEHCELIVSGCQGRCDYGPNINIYPHLTKYAGMTPEKARQIIQSHVVEGQPVSEWVHRDEW
jgi:(2Fe-2S) ferredoxin